MTSLQFATVPHLRAKQVKPASIEWLAFTDRLKHRIGPKEGPAVVFATFDEPRRLGRHVTGITALALDVDDGADVVATHEKLSELELAGVIWTTHSHTENAHRFRVVCPLDRPMNPKALRVALAVIGDALGVQYDTQCADPCRLFLLPACPPAGAPCAIVSATRGQVIAAAPLERKHAEQERANAAKQRQFTGSRITANELINKALEAISRAGDGDRNHTLNTWAFTLGRAAAKGELSPSIAEAMLIDAGISVGLARSEAAYTARRALSQGLAGGAI